MSNHVHRKRFRKNQKNLRKIVFQKRESSRIAKNAEQDRMRIKGEIVNPFLDILDSMQAAKNATYNEVSDVLEGLTTLNKQIEMVMENQGVVKIEGEDNDFDSRLHEAIDTLESDEMESDKIVKMVNTNSANMGSDSINPRLLY